MKKPKELEHYHWADNFASQIIRQKGEKSQYTIAAGITPSGTIHIGNFREIITVDLIKRALEDQNKKVRFIYSWDDNDVFRKVPKNLPNQDQLKENLRKPIFNIPDPFGCHKSYAEHFEKEMEKDLPEVNIHPEFIYQNQEYSKCQYAEGIKIALEKTSEIIEILNQYRKEPLDPKWLPIFVFCDHCKKDDLQELKWEGDYTLTYKCKCAHQETFDFRKKGLVTLRWRIDWPMRWWHEKVDFESGGKDHFAAGGSVETGRKISEQIYNYNPPFGFPYEWISIKGGLQFASSAGVVTTLKEMLEIYQPEIIRYLFASTRPTAEFSISFDADVIKIYEDYDKCERIYYNIDKVSDKEKNKQKRIYELSSVKQPPEKTPLQWSFRHLTTILQIHQLDIEKTIGFYEKEIQNQDDKDRLHQRAVCAKNWLEKHAPEDFKFTVQDEPQVKVDEKIKLAIKTLAEKLKQKDWTDVDLHNEIYIITQNHDLKPADFFKAVYQIVINKEKGPRLASFILQIGKQKVIKLFEKI